MKKNLECNVHVISYLKNKIDDEFMKFPKGGALGLQDGTYVFRYDYPLDTIAEFKHKLSAKTSARNILRKAARDYKKIYDIEDGKVGDPGHIPGMYNRARSDGPYGIWGHDIGDLFFEGIYIDTDKKTVSFGMGS